LRYLQPLLQISTRGAATVQDPRVRVALAQLDARLGDVEENLRRAGAAVAEAAAGGADLVVFPELFLSGYSIEGPATARPAEVAAGVGAESAAVVLGFHERDGDATYNSAVYAEGGAAVHLQRKLYLVQYAPFREDERYAAGEELRTFETRLGRFATLICNDAWQPVLPWLAALEGADVLLMPSCSSSAVPEAEAYWRTLTVFYARLLRCYVVFVNRAGSEGSLTFWGGSHVVDPAGEVIVAAPRLEEAIVTADLDLRRVAERRAALPPEHDPRLDLVRRELDRIARNQERGPL
jgi:predicted amidohydrolase